jgi:hypothetical protein
MQSMTGRQITGYPPRRIGELLCRTVHRRRSGTDGLLSACSFLAAESEAVAGFEKRQAGCGEQSQEISVGDVRFGDRTNGTATDEGKSGPPCLSHDYATDGFHSWTLDEVSQHQARHPIGTKARLALALLLFTGVRRDDLVCLGRQREGWLAVHSAQNAVQAYKRARPSEKPVMAILTRIIEASPTGDLTYLTTEYGNPFSARASANGFGTAATRRGYRTVRPTDYARPGQPLRARTARLRISSWQSSIGIPRRKAKVYTDAADRKQLAGEVMTLLTCGRPHERTVDFDCRTSGPGLSHLM